MDPKQLYNYCINEPWRITQGSYCKYTQDNIDIIVDTIYAGSIDKFLLDATKDWKININIIKYAYNNCRNMDWLIDKDCTGLTELETTEYFNILSQITINDIHEMYYNLMRAAIYNAYVIVFDIINLVGIDKIISFIGIDENSSKLYGMFIKYNMTLDDVHNCYILFDMETHDTKSLELIKSLADIYGYEFGMKLLLNYY